MVPSGSPPPPRPAWSPGPRFVPRLRTVALGVLALVAVAVVIGGIVFVGGVRVLRDLRATGRGWSWPSRLYTADLPLVVGGDLTIATLERELAARGYRRSERNIPPPGEYATGGDAMEIGLRGFDA